MIERKVVKRLAPSEAAASSTSGSSSISTGCTVRTMNGRVTNRNARNTAIRVLAQLSPSGLDGPYRLSSTRPATMVGSANGMSMTTSSTRLPGKWSRTSTQAIVVPITTLTPVTSTAWPTVSSSAARVWALVRASQYADQPPAEAWTSTAVSGMSTSRLNQSSATPSPSPGGRG